MDDDQIQMVLDTDEYARILVIRHLAAAEQTDVLEHVLCSQHRLT